ncbi:MAG TPA: hypothetical protein VD770_05540 [Coxiellaceae bacterium]|nr:hypothetical protein [Coxiellaceae bacterium]
MSRFFDVAAVSEKLRFPAVIAIQTNIESKPNISEDKSEYRYSTLILGSENAAKAEWLNALISEELVPSESIYVGIEHKVEVSFPVSATVKAVYEISNMAKQEFLSKESASSCMYDRDGRSKYEIVFIMGKDFESVKQRMAYCKNIGVKFYMVRYMDDGRIAVGPFNPETSAYLKPIIDNAFVPRAKAKELGIQLLSGIENTRRKQVFAARSLRAAAAISVVAAPVVRESAPLSSVSRALVKMKTHAIVRSHSSLDLAASNFNAAHL